VHGLGIHICDSFSSSQLLSSCDYHNKQSVATLALGLPPRQRGCKVAGQEEGSSGVKAKALQGCGPRVSPGVKARRSSGVTSHTPGSVRKCEGI